jgi:hypothetical protein
MIVLWRGIVGSGLDVSDMVAFVINIGAVLFNVGGLKFTNQTPLGFPPIISAEKVMYRSARKNQFFGSEKLPVIIS